MIRNRLKCSNIHTSTDEKCVRHEGLKKVDVFRSLLGVQLTKLKINCLWRCYHRSLIKREWYRCVYMCVLSLELMYLLVLVFCAW